MTCESKAKVRLPGREKDRSVCDYRLFTRRGGRTGVEEWGNYKYDRKQKNLCGGESRPAKMKTGHVPYSKSIFETSTADASSIIGPFAARA